jgi:putative CocE/NonD family hydrolase
MTINSEERVSITREIAVPMRDGSFLATDLYLPEGPGPFPTLIFRVRGSRSAAFITGVLLLNPLSAVRRGYAVVIQEVRGRGGSSDKWHPWIHELSDGEDCLNWIVAQPWCNGNVGAYGSAYSAAGALFLSMLGRPELKAIAVLGTGADIHDGWIYTSGAFELGWNIYWCYMTVSESISRLDVDAETKKNLKAEHSRSIVDALKIASHLPLRDQPLLDKCGETQFTEWLDHPLYDEYWRRINALEYVDTIKAPILSIVGWHDNFLKSHFDLYRATTTRSLEPSKSHHKMLIGPWEHCNYVNPFTTSKTGEIEFGPEAAAGVTVSEPLILDWMDRWVKNTDTGESSGIKYWQLGSNEWRTAPAWPPSSTLQRWFIHSQGQSNSSAGDGSLNLVTPDLEPLDTYVYDPSNPTPTVGGKLLMPTIELAGIKNQAEVAKRADVLVYTCPPLTKEIQIAGQVRFELWASSSAVDTDFTAKLVDIAPDGYCTNLADGIVRARHRESTQTVSPPLNPGEPTLFNIDMWDIAHTFLVGHQIRVEISSSNFPRFDRNLNTGSGYRNVPNGSESLADALIANQSVFHDREHPSALVLPVTSN